MIVFRPAEKAFLAPMTNLLSYVTHVFVLSAPQKRISHHHDSELPSKQARLSLLVDDGGLETASTQSPAGDSNGDISQWGHVPGQCPEKVFAQFLISVFFA